MTAGVTAAAGTTSHQPELTLLFLSPGWKSELSPAETRRQRPSAQTLQWAQIQRNLSSQQFVKISVLQSTGGRCSRPLCPLLTQTTSFIWTEHLQSQNEDFKQDVMSPDTLWAALSTSDDSEQTSGRKNHSFVLFCVNLISLHEGLSSVSKLSGEKLHSVLIYSMSVVPPVCGLWRFRLTEVDPCWSAWCQLTVWPLLTDRNSN